MDIVWKGRRTEIDPQFRASAEEKLARTEKLDHKLSRIEVEVCREHNPRLADACERVELTCFSRGPVIRAEAAADEPLTALDRALDKLESRLRRSADRRRVHHGNRTPLSLGAATASAEANDAAIAAERAGEEEEGDGSPFVVREKLHEAAPVSLDQALFEMELVGHDFYLFVDAETRMPSVVYRRRGYDYGVIRLRMRAED